MYVLYILQDWGKGIVLVNGRNLGRYWPSAGPTKTLYLPGPWLRRGKNEVSVLGIACACIVEL